MTLTTAMLCFPNRALQATLSDPTGAWLPSLPLSNLQGTDPSIVARTNGIQTNYDEMGNPYTAGIDINFGQLRSTVAMSLCGHNFSLSATIRFVLWSDYTMTGKVFDSGYQPVWPRYNPTLLCDWEDSNWWSGQINTDDIPEDPAVALQLVSNPSGIIVPMGAQYASIRIFDPLGGMQFTPNGNELVMSNPGYLQAGMLFMVPGWIPVFNFSPGMKLIESDTSLVDTAQGGSKVFDQRAKVRKFTGTLNYMSRYEGVTKGLRMSRNLGISGPLLLVMNPSDPVLMQQTAFPCRLSSQDKSLDFANCLFTDMEIDLEEIV
jgi:hypothetical protein